MEIIRHLSHEELTDLVIESDQQALRPLLEALPEWARTSAEQPEQFWQEQRGAVWSRYLLRDRPSPRSDGSPPAGAGMVGAGGDGSAGWIDAEPCSVAPPPQGAGRSRP